MAHKPKILAQAGISLADVYDIEGSVIGLETLEVTEIQGVHDLGPQIQSERLMGSLLRRSSNAQLQDVAWTVTVADFHDTVTRILGIAVMTDVAGRMTHVSLAIRDTSNNREMPIWAWDTADDAELGIEWSDDGAAASTVVYLRSLGAGLPNLNCRMGVNRGMSEFVWRGLTSGFGAGNVTAFLFLHIARPTLTAAGNPPPGEAASHGLPFPGW